MESEDVIGCANYQERVPHTNGDHVRAMTDEEMATFIVNGCFRMNCDREDGTQYTNCRDCWLDWLRKEANE